MPSKRDVNMEEYSISKYAYKELEYFCMQYNEKKDEIQRGYDIKSKVFDGMPRNKNKDDKVFQTVERIMNLKKDVEIIEQSAIEASSEIYKYILDNVTGAIPYEYMNVPCGRRQFYERRKLFFYILHKKRAVRY